MKTSTETKNILKALFGAQKTFKPVTKGAENPFFKSKYADLNTVLETVTEALNKAGIMILQPIGNDGTNNYVKTCLIHVETGEFIESTMVLALKQNTMQELGSATSYARRYTLTSLLTLQTEDDDGNAATGKTVETTKSAKATKNNTEANPNGTLKVINHGATKVTPAVTTGDDW